jgi:hypothetical protein
LKFEIDKGRMALLLSEREKLMPVKLATKTIKAIEDSVFSDQGASFRKHLEVILPKMEDGYRGTSDRHRSHFGFSSAGDKCARKLWFSWKWAKAIKFPARIQRLFNRGHLEEARFLALLKCAGFAVHYETADGGQFKIDDHNGHAGSAIDGVVVGLPDVPKGKPALVEMKTHSEKSFKKLLKSGVQEAHQKHFVQMQIYMRKYKLKYGLYLGVNKNDDELYGEIVKLDETFADGYIERAGAIIYSTEAPERISETIAWWECKYCDYNQICHKSEVPEINCRTCIHSSPVSNKRWHCSMYNIVITKEDQLNQKCKDHLFDTELLGDAVRLRSNPDEGWLKIKWLNREITLGNKDGVQYTTSEELAKGKYV